MRSLFHVVPLVALGSCYEFLAMVSDHGSGSSALYRRWQAFHDSRVLSVGELFSGKEKLYSPVKPLPGTCPRALFDDEGAPRAGQEEGASIDVSSKVE